MFNVVNFFYSDQLVEMDGEGDQPSAETENGTEEVQKDTVEPTTVDATPAPENIPQDIVKGNSNYFLIRV